MDILYQWLSELVQQFDSLFHHICEFYATPQPTDIQNAHYSQTVPFDAIPSATPMVLPSSATSKFRNSSDNFVDCVTEYTESKIQDASIQRHKKQSLTTSGIESGITEENLENTSKIRIPKRTISGIDLITVEENISSSLNKTGWDEPGTSSKMKKPKFNTLDLKDLRLSSGKNELRRRRVPDRPKTSLNLWTILKNFIGQDLSTIPLSVHFFEPLSMLQRLSEDFEYSELLDQAAACKTRHEQLAYLAAFTVASYSSTDKRMLKPFNPLLGETFEFDRSEDLGWRLIAEQVSHHPPISIIHCESKKWKFTHKWEPLTKLSGNSILMTPKGNLHIEFLNSGHKYTWKKVYTTVRNIILGTLYLDHSGEAVIKSEDNAAEAVCYLRFIPYSSFAKQDYRKIQGEIVDKDNMVKWLIEGFWNSKIDIAEVSSPVPWEKEKSHTIMSQLSAKTIWTRRLPEPGSEKYHNFTIFASELNEEEEGVAPTDSRLRPDQRLMEQGFWDEANKTKAKLEQKQRHKKDAPHHVAWFSKNEKDGEVIYEYGNQYWECKKKKDWSRCPDIF